MNRRELWWTSFMWAATSIIGVNWMFKAKALAEENPIGHKLAEPYGWVIYIKYEKYERPTVIFYVNKEYADESIENIKMFKAEQNINPLEYELIPLYRK